MIVVSGKRLRSVSSAILALAPLGIVACNSLTGTADLTIGDPPGGSDGGGSQEASTADGGNTNHDGGGGDGGNTLDGGGGGTLTIGGNADFLQSAGLVLANGSDTVAVDKSGAFTFKGKKNPGDAYSVTVKQEPPNQHCWVQNGAGTAQANVSNVAVTCSAILQSKNTLPGTQAVTTSTTYAPIPGIAPITAQVSRATTALVTLQVPGILPNVLFVGLDVDGTVVTELDDDSIATALSPVAVVPLAIGNHTIKAVYRTNGASAAISNDLYVSELNVVLLDSLPTFDHAYTTPITGSKTIGPGRNAAGGSVANSTPSPFNGGIALSTPSEQPLFAAAMIPNLYGDRVYTRLSLGSTALASASFSYDVNAFMHVPATPMAVTTLNGDQTLTASMFRWDDGKNNATFFDRNIPGSISAVLFKAGTPSQNRIDPTWSNPITSSFAMLTPAAGAMQYTLATTRSTHVLVTFNSTSLFPTAAAVVDIAAFVNGVQTTILQGRRESADDWTSKSQTLVGIVTVPAGMANTLDLRMRLTPTSSANNVMMSFPGNAPEIQTAFGYIALD